MENNNLKSFWNKPEGKPGMVILAGLGIGTTYLLYKFLPVIIELMANMYYAIGMGIGLFAIITTLMNEKFRTTVSYLYKGLMRWFTGMVIELNPIMILESYVEYIKKKLINMEEKIQELSGQIGKIKRKLTDKKAEQEKQASLGNTAKKIKGKEAEVVMYATQVQRLDTHIQKLEGLSSKMEILYKVLEKMRYYSQIMVKNTENEVEIRKEEREAITKSHSIMKSALNIINGNNDKKMMFDQAMEFVVDDIGFKVGEMDRMLDASTNFINSVDLENVMYEEKGMQMLEEFDKRGMETIFGTSNKQSSLNVGQNIDILSKFD